MRLDAASSCLRLIFCDIGVLNLFTVSYTPESRNLYKLLIFLHHGLKLLLRIQIKYDRLLSVEDFSIELIILRDNIVMRLQQVLDRELDFF